MDIEVRLKGGLKTENWTGVLAMVRKEPEIVLLHSDGGETIYDISQVRKVLLAS